ncbi:hypothetical protein ACFWOB_23245 [Streptomyces sp. NPDC058420]
MKWPPTLTQGAPPALLLDGLRTTPAPAPLPALTAPQLNDALQGRGPQH